MKLDMIIQSHNALMYPVLAGDVTLSLSRKGSPGKLTFSLIKDSLLSFSEGDAVRFSVDGKDIFFGFVFTKSRSGSAPEKIDVTAYDQLRYFKNKDTYVYENKKASEVVRMIAEDFRLRVGTLDDTGYIIPSRCEDDTTLFDIVQNALDETLRERTKLYVLYDDGTGRLMLTDTERMKLDLLLDVDTLGDFSYQSSIDKETYNQIKLSYEEGSDEAKTRKIYVARDSASISKYGLLQFTGKIDDASRGAGFVDALLKLYNAPTRTLSLKNVLGDTRVRGGSSVIVKLDLGDMAIQNYMLVESVTHKFGEEHIMDLKLRGGNFG